MPGTETESVVCGHFMRDSFAPYQFDAPPPPVTASYVGDVGYDATANNRRRKQVGPQRRSEDQILRPLTRELLLSNTRDIHRNFALCQWAVNQHLTWITHFNFHAGTDDRAFNEKLETFVERWGLAENFDAAGRDSLPQFVRNVEGARCIDGDVGYIRLAKGWTQGIESDRIRDPADKQKTPGNWTHGIEVNEYGRHKRYAIHKRVGQGFELDQIVPAEFMSMCGYYRRFDQVRGVSPLSGALNTYRDVYENLDHAQARAKISHLFALLIKRGVKANDDLRNYTNVARGLQDGPGLLDIDPDEHAEFLNANNNPSSEFQAFMQNAMMICLLALDLPISFLLPHLSNFFGSSAAQQAYERSCRTKRQGLQAMLNELTRWRLALAILDGEIKLPKGMKFEDIRFAWVPIGLPWWNTTDGIAGDLARVRAGTADILELSLMQTGRTFFQNVDSRAKAEAYALEAGVEVSFDPPNQGSPPAPQPGDGKNSDGKEPPPSDTKTQ